VWTSFQSLDLASGLEFALCAENRRRVPSLGSLYRREEEGRVEEVAGAGSQCGRGHLPIDARIGHIERGLLRKWTFTCNYYRKAFEGSQSGLYFLHDLLQPPHALLPVSRRRKGQEEAYESDWGVLRQPLGGPLLLLPTQHPLRTLRLQLLRPQRVLRRAVQHGLPLLGRRGGLRRPRLRFGWREGEVKMKR